MRGYVAHEYELYGRYIDKLEDDFGVNLERLRPVLGNPGGIFADTCYLLCRLVSHPLVNDVMEIGSGLSTLVLAKVAKENNARFVSLENEEEWASVACAAVSKLELPNPIVKVDAGFPSFARPFQLVWVDGMLFARGFGGEFAGRAGACRPYLNNFKDAVIVFDDAQAPPFKDVPGIVAAEIGRDPEDLLWFNPCDREDRHQAISLPSLDHYAHEIIKEVEGLE